MNKNQVSGRIEQAGGAVKEVAGKATGNASLEAKGNVQKNSGKAEGHLGDARERAKDNAKRTIDNL